MKSRSEFVALYAFWPFHGILNVYRTENFENVTLSTRILNIFQAFAYSAVVFGYLVSMVAQVWYCYDVDFQLRDMAPTLGVMMLTTQLAISHATLTMNLKQVNEIIANLRRIVRDSE